MSDIKCPFCQQELVEIQFGEQRYWSCINDRCNESVGFGGNLKLWQALIDTKKKLDDLSDKIGKLETELERTRKALGDTIKLAEEMLKDIEYEGLCSWQYKERLNKIKDKEQQ